MNGLSKTEAFLAKPVTDKSSDSKKFNHNLMLMMEQLRQVYPNDKDIPYYQDRISIVSKINAKIPSEMFMKFSQDYIDEIMTRNEVFFINELDPVKVLTTEERYLKLINKVRHLWKVTHNPKLKDVLWKYFQVMLIYGIRCQKRYDLVPQVNQHRTTPLKTDF